MKKHIARRSFLHLLGVTAAAAGLTACTSQSGYTPYLFSLFQSKSTSSEISSSETVSSSNTSSEPESSASSLNSTSNSSVQKAIVIFNFDELSYDNRAEILKQYGWTGTFNTGLGPIESIQDDVLNLVEEGHDIGVYCGGYGTRPNGVCIENGYERWKQFIQQELDEFAKIGLYLPTQYGCAQHCASVDIVNACKDLGFHYVSCGYVLSEGTSWDAGTVDEWGSYQTNSPNKMTLCPYTMPTRSFEDIKNVIDDTAANQYVLSLFTHLVSDEPSSIDTSTQIFTQVCDYVKELEQAGAVEVLNVQEFYKKFHPLQAAKDESLRATYSALNI